MYWESCNLRWDPQNQKKTGIAQLKQRDRHAKGIYLRCRESAISVIDIDGDNPHTRHILQLALQDCTMVAKTRKGYHLFFKHHAAFQGGNYQNSMCELDVRSYSDKGETSEIILVHPSSYFKADECMVVGYKWLRLPATRSHLTDCPMAVVDAIRALPGRTLDTTSIPKRKGKTVQGAKPQAPPPRPETPCQPEVLVSTPRKPPSPAPPHGGDTIPLVDDPAPDDAVCRDITPNGPNGQSEMAHRVTPPRRKSPKKDNTDASVPTPPRFDIRSPPKINTAHEVLTPYLAHIDHSAGPRPAPVSCPPGLPAHVTHDTSSGKHAASSRLCPCCPKRINVYTNVTNSNPNQALHNHVRDEHTKRGVFPSDTWFEQEKKWCCKTCGDIMAAGKREKHLTECQVKRDVRPPSAAAPVTEHVITPLVPPGSLPSLTEVCGTRLPTVKRLPPACRSLWTRVFTKVLNAAMHNNTAAEWTLLAMFPKCCAPMPHRAGRRNTPHADVIKKCLARWDAGEYEALWRERVRQERKGPARVDNSVEARATRAEMLVRDGEISRAMASLTSEDLAPCSDANLHILQLKHPLRTHPISTYPEPALPPMITEAVVAEALSSFARGSACGTMGLRAEFLQDSMREITPVGFATTLTKLVNFLRAGRAPASVQPFFAGANLSALIKKNKDLRPVAAGEVLRRLVSKCVCTEAKDSAKPIFSGSQFGVATPAGAERIIHNVRRLFSTRQFDPDFVVLKVDLTNAFNSISRARLLDIVRRRMPSLSSWVEWCYVGETRLTFGPHVLASSDGVQQGDPLGPLLFSLVLQEVVDDIARKYPSLAWQAWYLDDGVIMGDSQTVRRVFDTIRSYASSHNITLNETKCEVICHSAAAAALSRAFGDTEVTKITDGNFSLLGSPLGSAAFVEDFLRKEALLPTLRAYAALSTMHDPQVALTILRHCTGFCQFVYALRTTDPSTIQPLLQEADAASLTTLSDMIGALPPSCHSQVRRALKSGGFGIRSTATHSFSAYVASVSHAACTDGWDPSTAPGFISALGTVNAYLPLPLPSSGCGAAGPIKQRDLSTYVDSDAFAREWAVATAHDRRRLVSQSGEGATLWLSAPPSHDLRTAMSPREFSTLCRWWLGLDLGLAGVCPACNKQMDAGGYHALTCKKWGGLVYRHNSLANEISLFAGSAFLCPRREQRVDDSARRPGDVVLGVWEAGVPLAMDLAVTHVQQPSTANIADIVMPGSFATEYARAHKHSERALCEGAGMRFCPLVVEVFGSWSAEALSVLHRLAKLHALHTGLDTAFARRQLLLRLSVTLQRQNARMLLARVSRTSTLELPLAGCDGPDDEEEDAGDGGCEEDTEPQLADDEVVGIVDDER